MNTKLVVYNSWSGEKEVFTPIHEGRVGMYVCGPTVYSDVHLGNCRTFVSFDIIFRYLKYLGYQVRYVRNITDVGHLEGDADTDAEDKISKKARLEHVEPMEVVQRYSNGFHEMMHIFNTLPPSIEPRATGHIIEQIEMVQAILDNGYGYIKNGSVYFDVQKFINEKDLYGKLSGRVVEDLLSLTRDNLKNQDEKEHPSDFAIWIKADPRHLMRWNSPWSVGFPGWHLECSAMSTKYLGKQFDIHGGGTDLKFPHHENEIAQNVGACGTPPAKYWLHSNMLLMNGRKMSKSEGNTITPFQLFTGDSPLISKGYSPMVVRFFMLQSHYRSTLDLTDGALQAAEKGFLRLMEATHTVKEIAGAVGKSESTLDQELNALMDGIFEDMNDDFNTPKAMARVFDLVTRINGLKAGHLAIAEVTPETLDRLQKILPDVVFEIFGLKEETGSDDSALDGVMQLVIDIRRQARTKKDWATADQIRDQLNDLHIQLKDGPEGTTWSKS
ncbi:MAG: cysteine--tRNA ligase [Saprospiraceae bacterium]|nr:cysteine--tRNA ligase [Saprospiraceae bacterium]MCB9321461.1 cysteine--tRNA ligase [Lewinellaceae bacterium]